jgi:hypothetical protein
MMAEVRHQLINRRYSHVLNRARAECVCGKDFAVYHHFGDMTKGARYAKNRVVEIFNEHREAASNG